MDIIQEKNSHTIIIMIQPHFSGRTGVDTFHLRVCAEMCVKDDAVVLIHPQRHICVVAC